MTIATLFAVLALAGCKRHSTTALPPPDPHTIGNPMRGADLIQYYGCGSCHTISGVGNAEGLVGPPLNGFARRVTIAGMLRNTPDNLILWIQKPQSVVPGNAMPDMNVTTADARDIAAFLYTRK